MSQTPTPPTAKPTDAGAFLFEVAWEVCNQVGGIYQVIRSKAPFMVERWGDQYALVGPWVESKAAVEFEEIKATGWVGKALDALKLQGLHVRHGRWLIPGRPRVLLIDHRLPTDRLDAAKYALWKDHGISTPSGDGLIDEVVSFADACRRLFSALCEHSADHAPRARPAPPRMLIAHFHEWMSGLCIPALRSHNLPVATVFTTHATLLGRYIASNEHDFYDKLPWINQEEAKSRYNIPTQHAVERACAHGAHVFTTVSSITGEECHHLLGRPVDLVTPNALSIASYNMVHEQQRLHGEYKELIHRFTMGHFFPSYSFDLDKTLYFFTSGRFEPRNKGFDVCLEALARLNAELRAAKSDRTVVFFLISRQPTRNINPLAMEKRGVLNELREICEHIVDDVGAKLFHRAAAGHRLKLDDLVDEYWMLRYRRSQHAMKQHGLPMVVTHILEHESTDPVLNQLRYLQLFNRPEDPVKVVYHPDFINPHNRLWGIEYDQFVRGTHLGVFPSSYEPWGYTPLECLAMGVPAVTSDLAGFGRYVADTFPDHDDWGLHVLRRRSRSFHDAAHDLARLMFDVCRMDRRERIALRNAVDKRSWDFDWSKMGLAYHRAHDLALERLWLDMPLTPSLHLDPHPHPHPLTHPLTPPHPPSPSDLEILESRSTDDL
ncbi:MAG: glycogen/starch synthase [Phycisphaeraceae bacterium]|nr:MAG: glycogen/starch synthase [Phycisphaeraceae bacterium]